MRLSTRAVLIAPWLANSPLSDTSSNVSSWWHVLTALSKAALTPDWCSLYWATKFVPFATVVMVPSELLCWFVLLHVCLHQQSIGSVGHSCLASTLVGSASAPGTWQVIGAQHNKVSGLGLNSLPYPHPQLWLCRNRALMLLSLETYFRDGTQDAESDAHILHSASCHLQAWNEPSGILRLSKC